MLIIYFSRIIGEKVITHIFINSISAFSLSQRFFRQAFYDVSFFFIARRCFFIHKPILRRLFNGTTRFLREPVKHNENFRLKIYFIVKICVAGKEIFFTCDDLWLVTCNFVVIFSTRSYMCFSS